MDIQSQIRKLMQADLLAAQARRPGFSLRAFAKKINLQPSAVSEILNAKRPVTQKMAARILKGLAIAPSKANALLSQLGKSTDTAANAAHTYTKMDMDQFHVLSDWYYFGILSLADTDDFVGEAGWIARRLNISVRKSTAALERLERLGMLARNRHGRFTPTGRQFATSEDITHASLRNHHYQDLELSRQSLERDGVLEREFTFISIAADPDDLPRMKHRIRAFRDSFCAEFESGRRREVYKLCLHLIPLTKPDSRKRSRSTQGEPS